MTNETFIFRSTEQDGTVRKIEITAEQALDLGAGHGFSYVPHDERVRVDEDGTITRRESVVPRRTRPAGLPQLASSMAELWDEVLPPTPEEVWRENVSRVTEAMRRG